MARLSRILPNPHRSLPCETHHCSTRAQWILSQERGPLQLARRICTDDVAHMVETLPDDFLPAVRELVLRHVLEGTEFGTDLWERFRALHPGSPPTADGDSADIDTPAHLASAEFLVLRHITEGTEWGLALVAKIADAIPEDGAQGDAPAETIATEEQAGGAAWGQSPIETLMPYVAGAVATAAHVDPVALVELTEGDGGESPVNPGAEHACVCGWDPKPGSENPDRDLKAHQRFCKVLKGEKGDG